MHFVNVESVLKLAKYNITTIYVGTIKYKSINVNGKCTFYKQWLDNNYPNGRTCDEFSY